MTLYYPDSKTILPVNLQLMDYRRCQEAAEYYVRDMMNDGCWQYPHQKLEHAPNTVVRTGMLALFYGLDEEDTFIVFTAAWFHDLGCRDGNHFGYQKLSIQLMNTFLTIRKVPAVIIRKISNCIIATMPAQTPHTLLEEIVCDADTWSMGMCYFDDADGDLNDELVSRYGSEIADINNAKLTLLRSHSFYTTHCKHLLSEQKKVNIETLRSTLEKL